MAAGEQRSIHLPNTSESWPRVSENLRKISEGKLQDVEGFEKLYTCIESTRTGKAEPKFASLRRVLRDGDHVSERHFLDTLSPWIAGKALEVDSLFRDKNHQLPVRFPPLTFLPSTQEKMTASFSLFYFYSSVPSLMHLIS